MENNDKNLPARSEGSESSFLETIERLSANKDVDVDKIKQILDMQERVLDRNAEQAFNVSMVAAQSEMPEIPEDAKNTSTGTMYSKLKTIIKFARPVYSKHGFAVSFSEGQVEKENETRIIVRVMHEQGHSKEFHTDIPVDTKGPKGGDVMTKTHAKMSSLTYGQSKLMKMIWNIGTGEGDDDGNAAGARYISMDQATEINDLIKEKKVDKDKFLEFAQAESVEQIKEVDYKTVISTLKKK